MQSPSTGGVRFAPSPTGKFHVGNLRTAWISFQIAKALKLKWILRFEDIDQPRVLLGAQDQQLSDMKELGLIADKILIQSEFRQRHWDLFKKAVSVKQVYPCDCSRKEVQQALATMASAPHSAQVVYSGRCRIDERKKLEASESLAWRFKMPDENGKDDFIVARTSKSIDANNLPVFESFVPSYHWACAIDDFDGNYDLLVRSSDLRDSLQPQRAVHTWLGISKPIPVFHTSLVTQNDGHRLEKRTAGVALSELHSKQITNEMLIEIFEKSFDRATITPVSSDSSYGEKLSSITLANLGL